MIQPKEITPREKKTILENFLSLSTLQSLNYILPLLIIPYLIRVIGPEKFGLLAFAQALTQYFLIITDYGFSISATREISIHRKHHEKVCAIFSSVMTVKIIMASLSFLALLLLINFIPRFKEDWIVYVFSFGIVIGNTLFPIWFFQGIEKMRYITIWNIIGGAFYISCVFIFVRSPLDYLLVPVIHSSSSILTGIMALYMVFRRFKLNFIIQTHRNIRQQLKTGWDIFISVVAINAYTATRIFAVGLLTNNILTGYYAIAERISGFIQTFPLDSLSQALYPRLSNIFTKNERRATKIMQHIQKMTTFSYIISLPLVFLFSGLIVKILCGIEYKEITIALRLLLIPIFLVVTNAFRVQFLLVCGKADTYSRIHVVMAFIGLPIVFTLIYYFSYLGAPISAIIIETTILLWTIIKINKWKAKEHFK